MSKKIIAANWKLFKTPAETKNFFSDFFAHSVSSKLKSVDVVVFPPATNAESMAECLQGQSVQWGLQNIFEKTEGAYTGENSVLALKALGGTYALLGHSERRQYFHESNEKIAVKAKLAQEQQLTPMICIGESLEERDEGRTWSVLEKQLSESLNGLDKNIFISIAYEPVWAIGTGRVATVDQVNEVHKQIKSWLQSQGFDKNAVLYGGSVKPDNAKSLLAVSDVDGFLVGGASLVVESFAQIIASAVE